MDTASAINIKTKGWITSYSEKMKESHPDDLINAWKMGVNKGLDLKDKIIKQYFEERANKALEEASRLFHLLNDKINFGCREAYFRINDLRDFDILYIVDFDEYLSDKLAQCYNEALIIKSECKKADFNFNFTFKPYTKNTKVECILADGYVLKYAPKSRKA